MGGKKPEWNNKPARVNIVTGRGDNISKWITYFISTTKLEVLGDRKAEACYRSLRHTPRPAKSSGPF